MTTELFERRTFSGIVSTAAVAQNLDDPSITFGDTAAVFHGWGTMDLSLAVWHREFPPDIRQQLKEQRLEDLTGWRRSFDVASAASILGEAMKDSGFGQSALERFLAADMTLLSRLFTTTTGTSHACPFSSGECHLT